MAAIIIHVLSMGALEGTSDVFIACEARTSDMVTSDPTLNFSCQVGVDNLAVTMNSLIKSAAIAAASAAGHTVGSLDKKTLVGGVIGL